MKTVKNANSSGRSSLDAAPLLTPPLPTAVAALLMIAQTRLSCGDMQGALTFFERASWSAHPVALNMVGRAFERGWGYRRDPFRARKIFYEAALGGDGWGFFNLADLCLAGEGGPKDIKLAWRCYVAAAQRGVGKALNMLGVLSEQGLNGAADLAAARAFYEGGVKARDGWASLNAARLYRASGDENSAQIYLKLACDFGPKDVRFYVTQMRQPLHPVAGSKAICEIRPHVNEL